MGGRIELGLAAGLALVAGQAGVQERELLFPKSLDHLAPALSVEGVQLAAPMTVFYRGATETTQEDWKAVGEDEVLVQSSDWTQALKSGRKDGGWTWFERPPEGTRREQKGDLRFVIDAARRTTLAFSKEADEAGMREVLSLGPEGEVLARLTVEGLRWVSVSDDGARFTIATGSFVRVLERSGAQVLPDLKEATVSGALASDGAWLAVDLSASGSGRVKWISLREPQAVPVAFDVSAPGHVAFGSAHDLAAHVTPREVALFQLDDGGPKLLRRLSVPDGFVWRAAAFDVEGRLALGRIRIERRAKRDPSDQANHFRPGAAHLAVDFFASIAGQPVSTEWEVSLWNYAAPALAFAIDGRCIADAGHSAETLKPPWLP